eukprot:scaffold154660_cov56-Attheya_sp.AAC.3
MTTPMWGDAQGAYSLEPMSPLSRLLVQVTGPAHVPVNDSRWEQLLHCYDQLVHLEYQWKGDNVLATCAKNMARHAGTSSNLAALTLHNHPPPLPPQPLPQWRHKRFPIESPW